MALNSWDWRPASTPLTTQEAQYGFLLHCHVARLLRRWIVVQWNQLLRESVPQSSKAIRERQMQARDEWQQPLRSETADKRCVTLLTPRICRSDSYKPVCSAVVSFCPLSLDFARRKKPHPAAVISSRISVSQPLFEIVPGVFTCRFRLCFHSYHDINVVTQRLDVNVEWISFFATESELLLQSDVLADKLIDLGLQTLLCLALSKERNWSCSSHWDVVDSGGVSS